MSAKPQNTFDYTTSADALIATIADAGINFLALDFDLTIVDVHTGGQWPGSAEELCEHMRPLFREIIRAGLERGDMYIGICTFR